MVTSSNLVGGTYFFFFFRRGFAREIAWHSGETNDNFTTTSTTGRRDILGGGETYIIIRKWGNVERGETGRRTSYGQSELWKEGMILKLWL